MPNHFYPAEDSAKQLKIFNETLGLPEDARLPMPVKIGENSPVSLEAFHKLWGTSFKSKVLNQEDREVVMLAASQFNNCIWCVKVHCLLGSTMNIEEHDLNETAKGGLPASTSERHRIIAMATRKILSKKGALSDDDKAFYRKHGLDQTELQEILSTAMIMCFANYSNHLNQVAENQDDIQDATNQLTKALNIQDNFVATHAI